MPGSAPSRPLTDAQIRALPDLELEHRCIRASGGRWIPPVWSQDERWKWWNLHPDIQFPGQVILCGVETTERRQWTQDLCTAMEEFYGFFDVYESSDTNRENLENALIAAYAATWPE